MQIKQVLDDILVCPNKPDILEILHAHLAASLATHIQDLQRVNRQENAMRHVLDGAGAMSTMPPGYLRKLGALIVHAKSMIIKLITAVAESCVKG